MTREEAAMRLKEEVLDQLYYDRHMMTLKEIESWLYKHNCDEDALDIIMEIIEEWNMDAITKDLLDRRKKEIEWIQGTYKEAIAEAVNILNNEPEGEDWDTVREAVDTAQRALENIEGLQEEVEMVKMLNI